MGNHSHPGSDTGPVDPAEQDFRTQRDWEKLPSDPDLHDDLGYRLLDLEAYETEDGRVIFLPQDEDMIRNEAFIVAPKEDIVRIGE